MKKVVDMVKAASKELDCRYICTNTYSAVIHLLK